jgi:Tol biopolymer transport system component
VDLAAGQTLAHYEVLGRLGVGAMGDVWRARDTRLEREAALKVLPDGMARDEVCLRRFEREARALASLNHPNVAQVYGIDRAGGAWFIAMELVPGEDLAARVARGPLPLDEAIDVCRQIAEGVQAAHDAGVVHRDLKPANVRVTPAGTVKVLDFGLSRPPRGAAPDGGDGGGSGGASSGASSGAGAGSDAAASLASLTAEGALLGTPAYLSPEAARGRPADRRADVWAFGCILYECLTGRRPFEADSVADLLAAIVDRPPDLARLPAAAPPRVRRLVARCLDKNPRTRLQDIGEARVALSGARGAGAGADDADFTAGPAGARRLLPAAVIAAVVAAAALAAAAILFASRPGAGPAGALEGAVFRRLTDSPDTEFGVDIAPGGDFVVYGSDRGGASDVWAAQIDGGEPVNLSRGAFGILHESIRNMGFAGRGAHVWFMGGDEVRILAAPVTGGVVEPLLESRVVDVDWSRDGTRLAYHTNEPGDPLYVRDVDGPPGDPILTAPPGVHQHFPTWSFDEAWLYVVRGVYATGDCDLWRLRPDGGDLEQLTHGLRYVAHPAPVDADTVLFVAEEADGAGPWLWELDVPSRAVRRPAVGLERYTAVAAGTDGRRVVATVANPQASLWQVPLLAAGAGVAGPPDAAPLSGMPSARALSPRFAGDTLFYVSSRGSGDGLWMLRGGRAREVWAGAREPLVFPPSLSPDGTHAAIVRRRGERLGLTVVDVETRVVLRDFEDPIDVRGGSAWSPAGDAIVIGGAGPDGEGLFRFPLGGGPAERLVAGSARDPAWSPAGDLIVYLGRQVGPRLPLQVVRPDGTPVEPAGDALFVRVQAECLSFLPDGSGLVHMGGSSFAPELRLLDLATGATRALATLDERGEVRGFDVTPDGGAIVFDRVQQNSDVVLIELSPRR